MSSSILTARHLSKEVQTTEGALQILSDLDLSLNAGESLAIIGTSGSGKSTLLGLLAGLDTPSRGEIWLANQPLHALNEDQRALIRAEHVGFVFQAFQLLENLSAEENVMLPLELAGAERPREQARQWLQRVGLEQRRHHYPRQLSGGEQQRVALARAFAASPDILFADEPTGNLDSRTGQQIIDLLFALNQDSRTTLVLVTHDHSLAERCQHVLRLEAGRQVDAELQP